MLTKKEKDDIHCMVDQLPTVKDQKFSNWLMQKFSLACKREHRWKTHLDQPKAMYEYKNAQMMKRCIREAAMFEDYTGLVDEKIRDVDNMLAACMNAHELSPAAYQRIMGVLNEIKPRSDGNG